MIQGCGQAPSQVTSENLIKPNIQSILVTDSARYYGDQHGIRFPGPIHSVGIEGKAFVVTDDYLFAPFYNGQFETSIARIDRETGARDVVTFPGSVVPCEGDPAKQDQHDHFSIEISDDGVIHIVFGHHVSRLRYFKSAAGAASASVFDETLFLEPPNKADFLHINQDRKCNTSHAKEWPYINPDEGALYQLSYPRFSKTNSSLLMFYRIGTPRSSAIYVSEYRAGDWSRRRRIIDGFTGIGSVNRMPTSTRGVYYKAYGAGNTHHVTWTFREVDNQPHGLYYMSSESLAKTWHDLEGSRVALTNDNPHIVRAANVESVGAIVDPDITGVIMFPGVTADKFQRPHISAYVQSYTTSGVTHWNLYHYAIVDDEWKKTLVGDFTSNRVEHLVADNEAVYAVIDEGHTLSIFKATHAADYDDWALVHSVDGYDGHTSSQIVGSSLFVGVQDTSGGTDMSDYMILQFDLSAL